MSEPEHSFLPELIDEQTDTFSQAVQESDARLISYLYKMYKEDREIVERVEERLAAYRAAKLKDVTEQTEGYSRSQPTLRENWRKGPQLMKPLPQELSQQRKRARFLEMLVAVLVIAILVGSMAFVFRTRQSSQGSHVSSTPTTVTEKSTPQPTSTVSGQKGLYITTRDGIDRIDSLATGKVLWHAGSGLTQNALVDQGIVIFSGGDTFGANSSNFYIEAVNASNGNVIWRLPYGLVYTIGGAKGIVYVSNCSLAGPCSIDALQISNGHKLWSHSSSQGPIWELFQDGVVYGISYSDFFALNATTGVPLWQQTLQKYPYQEANMTPVVAGGAMYFSSCNTTKQTGTYLACYLFAFNANSGAELWHVPYNSMSTSVMAPPAVLDGVVYAASLNGVLRAYNAQTGDLLWTYSTGGNIYNSLVSQSGLVYVEVQEDASTMRLLALKVSSTSHSIAWSKNIHLTAGKPDGIGPDIQQDQLYLLDSDNNLLAFQAATGDHAQTYHPQVAAIITGFSLVL